MRLWLYVARLSAKRFLGAWALLLLIYSTVDLVEAASLVDASLSGYARLWLLRLPLAGVYCTPLALAAGCALTLAALLWRGEWDVMRAAGISPLSTYAALLALPCALVVPVGLGALWATPWALDQARHLGSVHGGARDDADASGWVREGEGYVFRDHARDCTTRMRLRDRQLWSWESDCGVRPKRWTRQDGWSQVQLRPEPFDARQALMQRSTPRTPAELPGAVLSLGELHTAIGFARETGGNPVPLEAELALRFGLSSACLVLPLLVIGWGLFLRWRSPAALVALCVAVAGVYWAAIAISWNLARVDVIPPLWVAVGVPILFGGLGIGMMFVRLVR